MVDVYITDFWLVHRVHYVLIAVFTAFAFWRSAPSEWMNVNLAKHWRWSVSLAFVTWGIVLAAHDVVFGYRLSSVAPSWLKVWMHLSGSSEYGIVSEILRWDLGTAAAAIVGATALRYAPSVSYFQRVYPRLGVFLYAFTFGLMLLCILMLPIRIGYHWERWGVGFGGLKAQSCLYALSFVLVAVGAFNLRHLLGLAALTCIISFMGVQALTTIWPVSDAGFNSRFLVWQPIDRFLDVASLALLGAMTVPYWPTLDATKLATRRTTILLGIVLSLEFVAKPALLNNYDELVLGGLAFVSGLIWGGRATIAVTIGLQLCVLLSYALFNISMEQAITPGMRLGAIAFPSAFFGLFARRAEQKVAQ